MKRWSLLIIPAAIAVFVLTDRSDPAAQTDLSPKPDLTHDPAAVFQKAFWKRPNTSDKILHAERREWKDEHGVSSWQWFLEVQPSPEIISYLREENAFRLSTRQSVSLPENAPPWFIKDTQGNRILGGSGSGMQLIFTPGDAKLYATSKGGGFRPGAPEKATELAQAPSATPPHRANP